MSPEARKLMGDERPRALGRGLSALIGDEGANVRADAPQAKGARTVPVAFLKPNPLQPRKRFAEEDLRDLAGSIKEKGVLQPILVRPIKGGDANSFEIVAGERRWRAAQMAKLHDVPIVVREFSDAEALEIAIIENVQRAELNAVEEATGYQELMDRFGYTQEKISEVVGKSRPHIANALRLLRLPEPVKLLLREGKLSAGHARTLIGMPDAEARAKAIVEGGLNVRQAEQRSGKTSTKAPPEKNADTKSLEASISNLLGLKVEISDKEGKGGSVKISYRTLEQLDEITRRLSKA
jgi:ParB family chromosome partitioning protein